MAFANKKIRGIILMAFFTCNMASLYNHIERSSQSAAEALAFCRQPFWFFNALFIMAFSLAIWLRFAVT